MDLKFKKDGHCFKLRSAAIIVEDGFLLVAKMNWQNIIIPSVAAFNYRNKPKMPLNGKSLKKPVYITTLIIWRLCWKIFLYRVPDR